MKKIMLKKINKSDEFPFEFSGGSAFEENGERNYLESIPKAMHKFLGLSGSK